MAYILGLFLIIALMLSGFSGFFPFNSRLANITGAMGNILDNLKNKTYEFIFSESGNEILIDNLNSNYDLLDRFFSDPSKILNSKDIPEQEKEIFKQALEAF